MSKVESPVDDAKKLAQRCKALEAQLRQTITKKEHHEIVLEFEDKLTAMEKTVSSQDKKIAEEERELSRTRSELQRTTALSKMISDVGAQVLALGKSSEAQVRAIDTLAERVAQGTVPAVVHQESLSKIRNLEEQLSKTVSRAEFALLQRRYEEAEGQIKVMFPAEEYEALRERVQALESAVSSMVPREQLDSSEATVNELRAKLAEHVPQSTYDDLVSKVVQLAEEVTGGSTVAQDNRPVSQPTEPMEPEEPSPADYKPDAQPEIPASPFPIHGTERTEPAPAEPPVQSVVEETGVPPEIREVGSQLAELKTEAIAEVKTAAKAPGVDGKQDPSADASEVQVQEGSELAPAISSASPQTEDDDVKV